ncbi:hypothetical protein N3K66_004262 [Trichothecium roseum]|uniref:Uncharacterized protein n=1 Tax=Trichothecium roseum TaxID=47278 RepID=A0ACC0V0T1_9HYPO|nr:hypothetical protein N3K66_004262 [Trichothecium roseum]
MNRYWIPNLDIHKRIITQELQYYLGPQATVRPYTLEVCYPPNGAVLFGGFVETYSEPPSLPFLRQNLKLNPSQGEDGFIITTPGPCLTDEQIDDICVKSREHWDKQAAAKAEESPGEDLKRPLHQPILLNRSRDAHRGGGR